MYYNATEMPASYGTTDNAKKIHRHEQTNKTIFRINFKNHANQHVNSVVDTDSSYRVYFYGEQLFF